MNKRQKMYDNRLHTFKYLERVMVKCLDFLWLGCRSERITDETKMQPNSSLHIIYLVYIYFKPSSPYRSKCFCSLIMKPHLFLLQIMRFKAFLHFSCVIPKACLPKQRVSLDVEATMNIHLVLTFFRLFCFRG